ncbi:MAG: GNAT family N-acetyltransferase [Proteobacteria bacterium]|nr:GNAT family N-acetyltransferase [Pseudomonadota bacterium]
MPLRPRRCARRARASSGPARRSFRPALAAPDGFALVPVGADGLPTLKPLVRAYYAEAATPYDEGIQGRALGLIAGGDPLVQAWLILAAGHAVGYVVANLGFSIEYGGRDAFIDELYVRPEHRNRGFAREALVRAETFLRARQVHTIHLEVKAGNDAALALYRRMGFVDHDRRLMSKSLA